MRREHRSKTVAGNTGPSAVLTSLEPPHRWLMALALKPRLNRSVGAAAPGLWPARPLLLSGRAHRPWRAMEASGVLRDTMVPSLRSWAVTPGDP